MCEANAYIEKDGREELVPESVDLVEPQEGGGFMLVDIFDRQKTARIVIIMHVPTDAANSSSGLV